MALFHILKLQWVFVLLVLAKAVTYGVVTSQNRIFLSYLVSPYFLLPKLQLVSSLPAANCDDLSHFPGSEEKHLAAARICQTEA